MAAPSVPAALTVYLSPASPSSCSTHMSHAASGSGDAATTSSISSRCFRPRWTVRTLATARARVVGPLRGTTVAEGGAGLGLSAGFALAAGLSFHGWLPDAMSAARSCRTTLCLPFQPSYSS